MVLTVLDGVGLAPAAAFDVHLTRFAALFERGLRHLLDGLAAELDGGSVPTA